ncbi:MAG TPA: MlaD family protein [Solirubrobacteraceae bacterium]|nr:MlaD family protein [Solirubrobacteraceae bacterium]
MVAIAALIAAIAVVGVVLLRGNADPYLVYAEFQNASQLVRGNEVRVAGAQIGSVEDIELTNNGGARVKLKIDEKGYTPLRDGTRAIIRLTSLSGVANRYIDLQLAGANGPEIKDGGRIEATETTSAVDLDQLIGVFNRKARSDLQGLIRGLGTQYSGRSEEARRGWMYLNPQLAATSRLFEELNHDTPALEKFIVSSEDLVTTLAERRDDLTGVVSNLADFTGDLAAKRRELSDAISQLPPFMRRANSTFVNLRAALDDLRPLVEESKPVAKRLRPFFAELRPLARDARPTIRDLSRLVRQAGEDNDLIELTAGQVPLRDIAIGPVQANGEERRGAFPETTDALRTSVPELAYARPYAVDLTGWFDDFGRSGVYDALGGISRVGTYINAFGQIDGIFRPIPPELRPRVGDLFTRSDQRNRCPGAAEHPADDGSNPWKPTPDHNCDPSQTLPGK